MLRKLLSLFTGKHKCFVIADARDNSVTLSEELCKEIGVYDLKENKVFVFRITGNGSDAPSYGFTINPKLDQETQLCEIQYNGKHKCIGFETLCPTVNRIFYDYRLPANTVCKLSVRKCVTPVGMEYYEIRNPNG